MTPIRKGTAKRLGLKRAGLRHADRSPADVLAKAGFAVPTQDQWAGIAKGLRAAAWHLLTTRHAP